jgi:hypothetical protein
MIGGWHAQQRRFTTIRKMVVVSRLSAEQRAKKRTAGPHSTSLRAGSRLRCAPVGMTKVRVILPCVSGGWLREPQVPPLRFAPVGMTIHIVVRDASTQEKLLSRKKSQTLGMTIHILAGCEWQRLCNLCHPRKHDFIGRQASAHWIKIVTAVAKEFALNRCFASSARQMMTPDGKTVAESCLDDALPVQT